MLGHLTFFNIGTFLAIILAPSANKVGLVRRSLTTLSISKTNARKSVPYILILHKNERVEPHIQYETAYAACFSAYT